MHGLATKSRLLSCDRHNEAITSTQSCTHRYAAVKRSRPFALVAGRRAVSNGTNRHATTVPPSAAATDAVATFTASAPSRRQPRPASVIASSSAANAPTIHMDAWAQFQPRIYKLIPRLPFHSQKYRTAV